MPRGRLAVLAAAGLSLYAQGKLARVKRTPRRRLLLLPLAFLLALASACGGGASQGAKASSGSGSKPAYTLPIDVVTHDKATLVLVPVTIQGHGPYTFMLDTGSSVSSIDQSLAKKLGLARTGQSKTVRGVASKTKVPLVKVKSWTLGKHAKLRPEEITAVQLPESPGAELQGLLGSDQLSGFGAVTIDYPGEKLRLQHAQ